MTILPKTDLYRACEMRIVDLGQLIDVMLSACPLGESEHERLSKWSEALDEMQAHCRDGVIESAKWDALEPAKDK